MKKHMHRNDSEWDKKLNIETGGRDDSHADEHHHPYEPTPYAVLERLADSGYLNKDNILVDYGCGKGRVSIFMHHTIGCQTIGLEYEEHIWQQATQNLESYSAAHINAPITFLCQSAESYEIPDGDCFYFFNPFTLEILHSVMNRILDSYYENPRRMLLFFYFPDDAYLSYLLTGTGSGCSDLLFFLDEIDCSDLFPSDRSREKILIFEIEADPYACFCEE